MSTFSDYFSTAAEAYASFRPRYPRALGDWLSQHAAGHERAWDCGTGSGQATTLLDEHFDHVVATDPSIAQLANAKRARQVSYVAMTAEQCALSDASIDLVTVAQALHWFDLSRFYTEVDRVLVPGGVVAVWTYGLLSIDSEIDVHLQRFHTDELGSYWPPERALVDAGYAGISFPFDEIHAPAFRMEADWTIEQLAGYLGTWSAVTRYVNANRASPVNSLLERIRPLWGNASQAKRITWPLHIRAGRRARDSAT